MSSFLEVSNELYEEFYQALDIGHLMAYLPLVTENRDDEFMGLDSKVVLGRGTHFLSFLLGRDRKEAKLVCSLAHSGGFRSRIKMDQFFNKWFQNMKKLKTLSKGIPLIPPFHVARHSQTWFYITPYGDQTLSQADISPNQIKENLNIMQKQLKNNGLYIPEHEVHLLCRNKIPFVMDLSDLKQC